MCIEFWYMSTKDEVFSRKFKQLPTARGTGQAFQSPINWNGIRQKRGIWNFTFVFECTIQPDVKVPITRIVPKKPESHQPYRIARIPPEPKRRFQRTTMCKTKPPHEWRSPDCSQLKNFIATVASMKITFYN